jgi:hypothetical protein
VQAERQQVGQRRADEHMVDVAAQLLGEPRPLDLVQHPRSPGVSTLAARESTTMSRAPWKSRV